MIFQKDNWYSKKIINITKSEVCYSSLDYQCQYISIIYLTISSKQSLDTFEYLLTSHDNCVYNTDKVEYRKSNGMNIVQMINTLYLSIEMIDYNDIILMSQFTYFFLTRFYSGYSIQLDSCWDVLIQVIILEIQSMLKLHICAIGDGEPKVVGILLKDAF